MTNLIIPPVLFMPGSLPGTEKNASPVGIGFAVVPRPGGGVTVTQSQIPIPTAMTTTSTTESYGASDVANLPLLVPFASKRPSESIVIRAIINEQHANDALATAIRREETLRTELQRVKSSGDQQQENVDLCGTRRNVPSSSVGNGGGGTTVVPRKNPKSKQAAGKNAATAARVREIESHIDAMTHAIAQCQTRLGDSANWTRAMLQSEYSKRAVLLESDSSSYAELEEAFNFLSARVTSSSTGQSGTETYFHEQRLAYVSEMLPVMKRVGERDSRDSLSAFPYVRKFQSETSLMDAMIDEMHQLGITQGLRSRLEKRLGSDPAKFKVLKHAEEMLDRRELETGELVRKHYRRRSVKLHPDRNGEVSHPPPPPKFPSPLFVSFSTYAMIVFLTIARSNYNDYRSTCDRCSRNSRTRETSSPTGNSVGVT